MTSLCWQVQDIDPSSVIKSLHFSKVSGQIISAFFLQDIPCIPNHPVISSSKLPSSVEKRSCLAIEPLERSNRLGIDYNLD